MRVLVPTDGSQQSLAALRYVNETLRVQVTTLEIHLLNVQAPLPSAVTRFIPGGTIREFHAEEGRKALGAAKKLLDEVPHEAHVAVGEPATTIMDYAVAKECDQIVMSSRGLGVVADLLIGSTARKVLHLARLPVTIVP